ncbi:MAG: DUF1987 domain-containing protein [Bacteroidales bacterium]|nr:DUF1987 domain-containing protein [Bacteroidales bacterium]
MNEDRLSMNPVFIEATQDTPSIILNRATNTFIIAERSYPEDAYEFYIPVLHWIEAYCKAANDSTVFEFKLDYFNTTSSKQIFKIMLLLEELSKNKNVIIRWYFKGTDREMKTHGEIFSKIITTSFELIEY